MSSGFMPVHWIQWTNQMFTGHFNMSIGHLAEVLDINPHPRLENRAIFDEISGAIKARAIKAIESSGGNLGVGGGRPPPPPPSHLHGK